MEVAILLSGPSVPWVVPEENRVAWVTGAGRGIGAASALALAGEGFAVALSARTREQLEAVAKQCSHSGVQTFVAPCDMTDPQAIEKAHGEIVKELGPPSVLVNNAGMARGIPFLKTSPEDMEAHWRTNLLSAYHCSRLVLPAMLESGWGRVVNVASVAGKVGAPYTAAYAVSKHALLGLTRSLAQEFAKKGVTVNAVCPGYVDTPMTEANIQLISDQTGRDKQKVRKYLENLNPQGRFVTPEEVAQQVAWLCKDSSKGINGQAVTIDGGGVQW
jgi:NAD(P)-dependent dehydrogenase (short-subunit alcohol dehydrogenase family)